jgi:hypothetical protein
MYLGPVATGCTTNQNKKMPKDGSGNDDDHDDQTIINKRRRSNAQARVRTKGLRRPYEDSQDMRVPDTMSLQDILASLRRSRLT